MFVRGIRGATVAVANTSEAIRDATRELLLALVTVNQIDLADIVSLIFTTTSDLTAEPPASVVRGMGWTDIASLCALEIESERGLSMCIRVLVHWNTVKRQTEIQHVYLRAAISLRPDRTMA